MQVEKRSPGSHPIRIFADGKVRKLLRKENCVGVVVEGGDESREYDVLEANKKLSQGDGRGGLCLKLLTYQV